MNHRKRTRIKPRFIVTFLAWAALVTSLAEPHSATAAPQITGVGFSTGKLNLSWSGTTAACDIQSAASPVALDWITILHTSRTNAQVPLTGGSGFLRVVTSDPVQSSLVLTTTNVSSGDVYTLTRVAQTNSDLVFGNLTDTNAATPVAMVLAGDDRQKFDVAFDGVGGFFIVNTNGASGGSGGVINSAAGPGPNQTTYSGFLTNGTDMVLFSSIAGPAPLPSGAKPMDSAGGSGGAADTASGAFSAVWCAAAWAGQNLGCQAAAVSRTLGCVGFFPPKPSGGYGYITNRTGVNLVVTESNVVLVGTCDSKCITCCKDLPTGTLSNCQ